MADKSHVSMEQNVCLICGATYDTGSILLDRRLKASLERYTLTGWGLCPEDQKRVEEGFVALIECDPDKSDTPRTDGTLKPWEVYRTGVITYLRREVFLQLFNIPESKHRAPCVYVEPQVTQLVKSRVAAAKSH